MQRSVYDLIKFSTLKCTRALSCRSSAAHAKTSECFNDFIGGLVVVGVIETMASSKKKMSRFFKNVLLQSNPIPSNACGYSTITNSFESQQHELETADECCSARCYNSPDDVPEGSLAVYVGHDRRRFVIPIPYLTNSVFQALLAKSAEEFGFRCDGGLRIACTPDVFENLLWWLQQEGAASQLVPADVAQLVGLATIN